MSIPYDGGAETALLRRQVPTIVKGVNAVQDAAAGIAIWTPASGKRVRVTGYSLQCFVSVTLQTAAAGDHVILYDNAVTAPFAVLGVCIVGAPLAGSILNTGVQANATPGAFAPAVATGAQGANLFAPQVHIPGGFLSSAADNVIKVALVVAATQAVVDVGTGELNVIGTIWGHEE